MPADVSVEFSKRQQLILIQLINAEKFGPLAFFSTVRFVLYINREHLRDDVYR